MGCAIEVFEKDGELKVTGNTCKRGELYGKDEFTHPRRSVTTLANMSNGEVASVRTTGAVPKERIFDVVNFIGKLTLSDNVSIGDVAAKDVLGLGVDVIVTGRK